MKGKVAMVTGGSSGIGQATAMAFAKEGARVVIASRSKTKATEAVRAIEKLGGEVTWIQADVSDAAQVQNMVRIGDLRRIGIGGGLADVVDHASASQGGSERSLWVR